MQSVLHSNGLTIVRLVVVRSSRQYNVVVSKALFGLNYFKVEVFKAKRRAVLGMGDYRQLITDINSCVCLEHPYKKVPHINLNSSDKNSSFLHKHTYFERKIYIDH